MGFVSLHGSDTMSFSTSIVGILPVNRLNPSLSWVGWWLGWITSGG